jgi:hypothetical protein
MKLFTTLIEAQQWFADETADLEYSDNYRFAFDDDAAGMAKYAAAQENGCCGSWDKPVQIAGRWAMFGCNFGH